MGIELPAVRPETETQDDEDLPPSRVVYLNYRVIETYGWDLDDDDLFEKAAEADLDELDALRNLAGGDPSRQPDVVVRNVHHQHCLFEVIEPTVVETCSQRVGPNQFVSGVLDVSRREPREIRLDAVEEPDSHEVVVHPPARFDEFPIQNVGLRVSIGDADFPDLYPVNLGSYHTVARHFDSTAEVASRVNWQTARGVV